MYEGLYDTKKGLAKADAKRIGSMTASLLLPWDRWVHRRVERATFCGETALRRSVSVDFTLPHWFHQYRQEFTKKPMRHLVPLGFLRKGALVNFTLQDECGASLPLLTAPQNAQVATATLAAIAKAALGGKDVPGPIECDIRELVRQEPDEAKSTFRDLFNGHDSAWGARQVLHRDSQFANTAWFFVNSFLALTMLKVSAHERRVLHFAYEESIWSDDPPGLRSLLLNTVALAAGRPRVFSFPVPSASHTQSYHFEVEAPDGLHVTAREGFLYQADGSVDHFRIEGAIERAHFHFSQLPLHQPAEVGIDLLPRRATIVRAATLIALLALVMVGTIAWRLPTGEGDAATTILLAITGLIGLVVVRASEDHMSTTLLFPLRLLAVAPVVLAIGAALVIVAHPTEAFAHWALGGIAFLIFLSTFALARNWRVIHKAKLN